MPVVALVSGAGGVGRSSLVALLATLAAREASAGLALELDPAGTLALLLGAPRRPVQGWCRRLAQGADWADIAWRANDDGTLLLPCGVLDAAALATWHARLRAEPGLLPSELSRLGTDAARWTFLDTPRAPDAAVDAAVSAADMVLLVVRPDAQTLALLNETVALAKDRRHAVVLNAFDASRVLQVDMQATLLERLGSQIAPHVLHRDEALPASQARRVSLLDAEPHAQLVHDVHGLWRWLRQRWEAP